MVGNDRKWSEMIKNGRKWVVIKIVVGHGLRWYGVVRSGRKLSGVVGNCREWSVVVGNDKKQPRLSSLINTQIVL